MLPFAFTPEGDELLLRSQSGVQFIDLEKGQESRFIASPQTLFATALSPDGRTLALSLADNAVQLIGLPDGEVAATLEGHPDLEIEQNALRKIPTWPWQPGALRAVVAALLLPVAIWVIQTFLGRVLGV